MSFGGKNPPWARPAGDVAGLAVAGLQAQVGVGAPVMSQPGIATPTVYSLSSSQPSLAQHQYTQQQVALAGVQNALAQQGAAASLLSQVGVSQPGIAIPTTLASQQVATVSYPAPRAQTQPPPAKQRVFTGTVTKLHDNFGFVDEDVFFQTTSVKGVQPKVNDRVLVEASYNANMPFKWNATRIQVLPNQVVGPAQPPPSMQPPVQPNPGQGLLKPPPMMASITPSAMPQPPPPLMGQPTSQPPQQQGNRGNRQQTGGGRDQPGNYERDRSQRDRDRERERRERRERRASPPKRSRSPRRSRSPSSRTRSPPRSRRPARAVPRYMVQIPKISLDTKEVNVISLRSRYQNLYIPSDFFNAQFSWTDAFPVHQPFELGHNCGFHVFNKEVVGVEKSDAILEPSDADHLFSAKVMLMASPQLQDLYHKSCGLAEDSSDQRESFQHPTRLLQFLVGLKGKSEPMAIGGPWSPALDGPNPGDDPRTLIKTAIRTTRALTGIDLSNCTQWYRFAEMRYHRAEEMHKGRLVPARVETVVIFLPDVWSCSPSRLEWESLQTAYKKQLQEKITAENKEETQDEEEEGDAPVEKIDPTHYSELDPKAMKVCDLRRELESRTLSSKGLKSQLIARLTKAVKTEQEKEEEENEKKEEETKEEDQEEKKEVSEKEEERKKREEEDTKRREERERVQRERRYTLPENPAILVHPNPQAKGGKFDCTVMSLSVLLDYRPEDNKEHSFEVSLFAELFNEMLMRDFGFKIYKSLLALPEKPKEDKKKDKDKDKDHKDKEKDKKDDKKSDDKKDDKKTEDKKTEDKKSDEKKKEDDEKSGEPDAKKRKTEDKKEEEKKEEKKEEKEKSEEEMETETNEEEKEKEKKKDESKSDKDKKRDRDKDKDKEKEKEKDKTKFMTENPALLLAFVYFDQSHTGYLLDKDAEEIMHTMGLHLSRSQVRKQINKLVSRDILNYRKLTDKPITKEEKKKEGEEETSKEAAAAGETEENKEETKEEQKEEASKAALPDEETIGLGNKLLLSKEDVLKSSPSKRGASRKGQEGLVMYKGAMVDIASVLQRSEKSEKTRAQLEAKLKELQDDMDELQTNLSSSEQTGQKVALELADLKKRLREQKRNTETANQNAQKFQEVLVKARTHLSGLVDDCNTVLVGERKDDKSDIKSEIKGEPSENGIN